MTLTRTHVNNAALDHVLQQAVHGGVIRVIHEILIDPPLELLPVHGSAPVKQITS